MASILGMKAERNGRKAAEALLTEVGVPGEESLPKSVGKGRPYRVE